MGNKKIIIAIDGHSSTGKSTVAKRVAKKLDYIYADTGAMYRAVTYYGLKNGIITDSLNENALIAALSKIEIRFKLNKESGVGETILNAQNVEKEIRTIEVSNWVSPVAELTEVRRKLVEQQQEMGLEKGIVMDGRDIGTVVFPDAELKIFMTASAPIRAKRRYNEMKVSNESISFEEVLDNVEKRDHIDSNRKDSPLIKAKDAILLDNSELTEEEQYNYILKLAEEKLMLSKLKE